MRDARRKKIRSRMKEILRDAREIASMTGKPIRLVVEEMSRFERAAEMLRDVNLYR